MRARHAASALAALLVLTTPALARAPADQYGFFNRDDTEIVDNFTRLTWERNITFTGSLAQARAHCAAYRDNGGSGAGGFRVPTVKELSSLVDEDVHQEYELGTLQPKAIDPNAFPHTPSAQFWADSGSVENPGKFWTVDFRNGTTADEDAALPFPTRCVRSAP